MKNYEFDAGNKVFRMTESFDRKASQVGTEEYRVLLKVRHDYPDVKVVKTVRQKGGRKLNYDMMLNYISLQENAEVMEKEFKRQQLLARVQPMPYKYAAPRVNASASRSVLAPLRPLPTAIRMLRMVIASLFSLRVMRKDTV